MNKDFDSGAKVAGAGPVAGKSSSHSSSSSSSSSAHRAVEEDDRRLDTSTSLCFLFCS
jgi:hypothetical protein